MSEALTTERRKENDNDEELKNKLKERRARYWQKNGERILQERKEKKMSKAKPQPKVVDLILPTPQPQAQKRHDDVHVTIETITPEIATQWMKLNLINRPKSKGTIEAYADDMREDGFPISESAIVFDDSGHLSNGQHRLEACIKSGKSFDSIVLRGLKAHRTIDIGRPRKMGDFLTMEGHKCATRVAAASRWLLRFKHPHRRVDKQKLGSTELWRIIDAHPDLEKSACLTWGAFGLRPSLLTAIHYVGSHLLNKPDKADQFVAAFTHGKSFYEGDAAIAWRERLVRMREQHIKLDVRRLMSGTIHAWNHFAEEKPIKVFKVPHDCKFEGLDISKI